ncbi:ATP-binding protein [Streptomyces sp. TP-A0356]|uniref:ATP-binding protein n=1 Tax=Streptomyces sp. TP-A0356 TaxID=1359208 RepID=UPI001F22CE53|nr:ATP-binding protein [Streptomyces sp. TP-A0356]
MSSVPETAAEARRLARQCCALWAFDEGTGETAALLISELVTNAVRHGRSHSIRVRIERPAPDRVRLAAVDKKRCSITLGRPSPENIGGRGLALVDALSDRWGVDLLPWGKRVWAEIRVKGQQ